ncbi:MAG: ABC transporter permease, partial [Acidobacteriota bacterium]
PGFRRTFRITRSAPDVPRDVADELDLYLDLRTEELIEQGLEPDDARRRSEVAFGNRRGVEAECRRIDEPLVRERRRSELFASILGDMRHALRDLGRRPTFALTACLTLAVCIALNTALYSAVRTILLQPLPYPEPDRIVTLFNSYPKAGFPRASNTVPEYFERRAAVPAFEEVALYDIRTRSVGEPGAIRRARSMFVTPSYFRTLGVEPLLGRNFLEDAAGAEILPAEERTAILSFGLWQQLFAGDPEALGQALRIEGRDHTVVGIMPEGFAFPGWDAQLYMPVTFSDEQKSDQGRFDPAFQMLARLRPEATIEQAKAQVDAWNASLIQQVPAGYGALIEEAGGFDTRIVGLQDDVLRHVAPWLYLLWGGSLFVLLIGGVSLTNLLLVRSTGRLRELATRYVLGAGRTRLLRLLLIESLVLALIGGSLGILVGTWSLRWLQDFSAFQIPRVDEVALDAQALAAMLLLAVLVMTVSSLVAAWRVGRQDLFSILRSGSATARRGALRLRGALAAAQIAIACILLIGAALMSVSLWKLLRIDPGFEAENVLAGAVNLPESAYAEPQARQSFFDTVLNEVGALPGVTHVALASQLPLSGDSSEEGLLTPEGFDRQRGDDLLSHGHTVVSPDYFSTLEIPLLAGRLFDERDNADSRPVIIVSQAVTQRYWGTADDALGQRVYLGVEPFVDVELGQEVTWHTVVGVVGDIVLNNLTQPSQRGGYYLPYLQRSRKFVRLVIKTDRPPFDLLYGVRSRIQALDPGIVLFWVTTLEESLAGSLLHFRVPMRLLSIFAAVALLLAAIGIYGVLAQSVAQRTKEISIRMALGSSLRQIYRWVLRSMLVFVLAGLALGLAGALSLSHLMSSLLYEVQPTDPAIFGAVGILITVVALLAGAVPARRATRIDPIATLSSE